MLAPYAVSESNSRGREHGTQPSPDRNEFQRDYSRIIHSRALRRLQGKTQVFSSNRGDLSRTRLTHSMEVEQLARAGARRLNLNEDLCGVLAIAHDIGHTPFGHMGQDTLQELMTGRGGFEHNLQALRIVDELESPYWGHEGLNLMFETREGLLKHCTKERALLLGEVASRHLTNTSPPLETQLVDWVDAIAYLHADLEDAYNAGVLTPASVQKAPGYAQAWERIRHRFPGADHPVESSTPKTAKMLRQERALVREVIGDMLHRSMENLMDTSAATLAKSNPQSLEDVRALPPQIGFSEDHLSAHYALKKFSRTNIYSHPDISTVRKDEKEMLVLLFRAYERAPEEMTGRGVESGKEFYRALTDHISGMTDSFVHKEFNRLSEERPDLMRQTSSPRP
jgi:dGTPase